MNNHYDEKEIQNVAKNELGADPFNIDYKGALKHKYNLNEPGKEMTAFEKKHNERECEKMERMAENFKANTSLEDVQDLFRGFDPLN